MSSPTAVIAPQVPAHRLSSHQHHPVLAYRLSSPTAVLACAVIDLSLLGIELAFGQSVWGNVLTGSILAVFMVVLRVDTYRYLFFRSFFGWFDLTVVVGSTALFIVGLVFVHPGTTVASSAAAVSRGAKAVRGVAIALRASRAVRVANTLVRVGAPTPQPDTLTPQTRAHAFGTRVRGRGGHLSRPRFGTCQFAFWQVPVRVSATAKTRPGACSVAPPGTCPERVLALANSRFGKCQYAY